MKDGLLYIVFVIFTLILISSKHSDVQQSYHEKSSIEFSIGNKNIVGTVPEFNFSLKKVLGFSLLTFVYDRIPDVTKVINNNHLLATNFKRYRAKTIGIQHFHKKTFLLKTHNTYEKEDSYHLS